MSKPSQQFKAGSGGAGGPISFPAPVDVGQQFTGIGTVQITNNSPWPTYTDALGHHGRRFVITENDDEFVAIIKNWRWWSEFEKEVFQWLDDNEIYYELQGMVLTVYNKDDFAMFILRWG